MSAIRSNVSSHVSHIFDAMPPDTKSLLAATWPCCICPVHEHASVSSFEHSRMPPSVRRPTQSRGNSAKTKVFLNPSEVTGYPAPSSPIGYRLCGIGRFCRREVGRSAYECGFRSGFAILHIFVCVSALFLAVVCRPKASRFALPCFVSSILLMQRQRLPLLVNIWRISSIG